MRARLTRRFVVVVALALAVGGLGSLLLAAYQDRQANRDELRRQATAVATGVDETRARAVLQQTARVLHLQGAEVVVLDPKGAIANGRLPEGITLRELDVPALQRGEVVSGAQGRRLFAAAPIDVANLAPTVTATTLRPRPRPRVAPGTGEVAVVVLTRLANPGIGRALGYLIVAGALALLVAAVVGDQLGRRFAAPLLATEEATRRIAGGDLGARVPVAPGEAPELASLAASVNTMAEALAASKGLERQFLLSVSHDLRTPMTSIRGFAEAIADGTAPDPARAAGVIATEAQRLERLVGDLLQLATLDARRFTLEPRIVDLVEVVADAAAGLEPMAARFGLRLEGVDPIVDAPPAPVTADPDRLGQVVANLTENAIKYATSTVRLTVWPDGPGHACLAVDDDGPGIAPADLPHVFDRLYQSSERRSTRQLGTGLGLAIVAELVGAMGGRVWAEAAPGGGTRMVVHL